MSKDIYSLFIGRWQYVHKGHKALITTALDRGKKVCVAIRDTKLSQNDPYSIKERKRMIKRAFPGQEIKVIVIPDIDEILYGRNVGYKIEQVHLTDDLHKISATKLRSRDHN